MAVVNVNLPDRLKRWVDSEAALVGLRLRPYVARALWNQVRADRKARGEDDRNDKSRVQQAKAEADEALALSDD